MKHIFIIIPAIDYSGPVKGAIALANAIAGYKPVSLVYFKKCIYQPNIISSVNLVDLSCDKNKAINVVRDYRRLLRDCGDKNNIVSISMAFSADMINLQCLRYALVCSSVRSNLYANYSMDYGVMGYALAFLHLLSLRLFDQVFVMTGAMYKQVKPYVNIPPKIVGNFIDERRLTKYRVNRDWSGPPRFIFLGSITKRKRPDLVVKAIKELHMRGNMATLDIIGCGPLSDDILVMIENLRLQEFIKIHGQMSTPYSILASADVLVLPSLSEGVSRAALEALYLGTPCVLRDVDGNSELIKGGKNGVLFNSDDTLVDAMIGATHFSRSSHDNLIPTGFKQFEEVNRLLKFINA
jgi:glycosyltransferase involved in cell wall biosynthesis